MKQNTYQPNFKHDKNNKKTPSQKIFQSRIGQVHRAKTQYIDKDTKKTRRFVIVKDNGENIKVSKLKSIKSINKGGQNADPNLIELLDEYPQLAERTGVDYKVFNKNRYTKKKLKLDKHNGFNPDPDFKLTKKDNARVNSHVHLRSGKNRRRGF